MAMTIRSGLYGMALMMAAAVPAVAAEPEHIIWNDTPAPAALAPAAAPAAQAPVGSSAPIRDSFAPGSQTSSDQPITWYPKPSSTGTTQSAAAAQPTGGQGRACREFQQKIMIEGKLQNAHGRACQQPDGSWRIVN